MTMMSSQIQKKTERLFQGFEINPLKNPIDYIFDEIYLWQKL